MTPLVKHWYSTIPILTIPIGLHPGDRIKHKRSKWNGTVKLVGRKSCLVEWDADAAYPFLNSQWVCKKSVRKIVKLFK
jgi:hypothetical protein